MLKCGCIPDHYWCSKHDIYTGNVPPWGAGSRRAKESKQVYDDEYFDDMDKEPQGCSCHISAPCSYCVNQTEDEELND